MSKRIVVYYSLTNNTKEAAENIANQLNAELYGIQVKKEIPKDDQGKMFMIGGMQAIFGMKPGIETIDKNFDEYDEIIFGMPVWGGKNAAPINTFLANKSVREKITAVFTSSAGGDNDTCIKGLQKKLPNMKYTVSLADRSNSISSENPERINQFVKEIENGEK